MRKIEILENGNIKVTIPIALRSCSGRKRIIAPDAKIEPVPLVLNIARAFRWQKYIDEGKFSNLTELARSIGRDKAHVAKTIRLTLLSPKIIHAALSGTLPQNVGIKLSERWHWGHGENRKRQLGCD